MCKASMAHSFLNRTGCFAILFNKAVYSLITFWLLTFISGTVISIASSSLCCVNWCIVMRLSTMFRILKPCGLVCEFRFRGWGIINSYFTGILNTIHAIPIGYSFLWICMRSLYPAFVTLGEIGFCIVCKASRACSFLNRAGCFAIFFNKAVYCLIVFWSRAFINGTVISITTSSLCCINGRIVMFRPLFVRNIKRLGRLWWHPWAFKIRRTRFSLSVLMWIGFFSANRTIPIRGSVLWTCAGRFQSTFVTLGEIGFHIMCKTSRACSFLNRTGCFAIFSNKAVYCLIVFWSRAFINGTVISITTSSLCCINGRIVMFRPLFVRNIKRLGRLWWHPWAFKIRRTRFSLSVLMWIGFFSANRTIPIRGSVLWTCAGRFQSTFVALGEIRFCIIYKASRVHSFLIRVVCFAILINKAIYSMIVSWFRMLIKGPIISIATSSLSCIDGCIVMRLSILIQCFISCILRIHGRWWIRLVSLCLYFFCMNLVFTIRSRTLWGCVKWFRFAFIAFSKIIFPIVCRCIRISTFTVRLGSFTILWIGIVNKIAPALVTSRIRTLIVSCIACSFFGFIITFCVLFVVVFLMSGVVNALVSKRFVSLIFPEIFIVLFNELISETSRFGFPAQLVGFIIFEFRKFSLALCVFVIKRMLGSALSWNRRLISRFYCWFSGKDRWSHICLAIIFFVNILLVRGRCHWVFVLYSAGFNFIIVPNAFSFLFGI